MGQKIDFDDYAEGYLQEVDRSISFIPQSAEFFVRLKAETIENLIEEHNSSSSRRTLDFGCGTGQVDRHLGSLVGDLYGVDLGWKTLLHAHRVCPRARYVSYDGSSLPYRSNSFDLVFSSCVFHHILPERWSFSINEIRRILTPRGWFIVFEHNPLNPLTRLAVWRCGFDKDATLLHRRKLRQLLESGGLELVEDRFIAFAPWRGKLWDRLNHRLGRIPLGGQYYLMGRKPSGADAEDGPLSCQAANQDE